MPVRIQNLAAAAAARVPTLLSLVLLAALGFWGARNDWKLPPALRFWERQAGREVGPSEAIIRVIRHPDDPPADPSATVPVRLEFPSEAAVHKAGLGFDTVQVHDLARYVTANGMVDYEHGLYAQLTSRSSGTVWRVYKEIGERIHKGDVLALIDAAEVGRAKTELLQSLVQVKLRNTTLERLRPVGQVGAVSERAVADAEAALREAQIRLLNDQQTLLNLGLALRLEELDKLTDAQVARRLRVLGLPESVQTGLDPETLTTNLLPLTAPFDGQVVDRNAAVGEVLESTQRKTLFIVADTRQLHIDLSVNPGDMAEVRAGQAVLFQPSSSGAREITAHVAHVSPEVDEKTRHVVVHAEFENSDGSVRPHAFGTGKIVIQEPRQALAVPGAALQADGSAALLFVRLSATLFEARHVQTGLRDGDLVEVSGVRAGEEVVTTGSFALKSELQKERIAGGDD
jgi:cobalt-zinc-cadmium efflux system membrane fusion protein